MRFPKFTSFSSRLFSTAPPSTNKDQTASAIGAGVSETLDDHYYNHKNFLKWIEEAKSKLPHATPLIRREAFLADPLLKGTIYPYLKNVLLQGYTIQTKDNKLYSQAIEEIEAYLEQLEIMQVFREDFLNFMILDGHTYRRIDPDIEGNIVRLEKLDPSSMVLYNDPWDSSIIAYHQHARVVTSWSSSASSTDFDSWFIPFGTDDPNKLKATYIEGRTSGNDPVVKALFDKYQQDYSITAATNLRIAASERIMPMHNSERLIHNGYYDDEGFHNLNNPAPIDSILLAIWLKRLLMVNSPNLVYIVLNPFLHIKSGIIEKANDPMGNTTLVSSNPKMPSDQERLMNPSLYQKMLDDFKNWEKSLDKAAKDVINNLKNGGVYTSGPDIEIKPIESSRTVPSSFISLLMTLLNEEIGQAFGFPMALILATGTELASSRNILQMFNTVHAGERTEYESVANKLIKKQFAGKTWQGKKTENGKDVTVTYKFEDIQACFELDIPDTKDLLTEAQAINSKADTLDKLKAAGASKDDLIALGEEYGFGLLCLDNFDTVTTGNQPAGNNANPTQAQAVQAIAFLKSALSEVLVERGIISAKPTDPSGFEDKELNEQLQEAYETAKKTIDKLFEEE